MGTEEDARHICVCMCVCLFICRRFGKGQNPLCAHWVVSLLIEIITSTDTSVSVAKAPSVRGGKWTNCRGLCTGMVICSLVDNTKKLKTTQLSIS